MAEPKDLKQPSLESDLREPPLAVRLPARLGPSLARGVRGGVFVSPRGTLMLTRERLHWTLLPRSHQRWRRWNERPRNPPDVCARWSDVTAIRLRFVRLRKVRDLDVRLEDVGDHECWLRFGDVDQRLAGQAFAAVGSRIVEDWEIIGDLRITVPRGMR